MMNVLIQGWNDVWMDRRKKWMKDRRINVMHGEKCKMLTGFDVWVRFWLNPVLLENPVNSLYFAKWMVYEWSWLSDGWMNDRWINCNIMNMLI